MALVNALDFSMVHLQELYPQPRYPPFGPRGPCKGSNTLWIMLDVALLLLVVKRLHTVFKLQGPKI
jgi:hypothetical protein